MSATGWRSARPTSCGSAARSCARSPVATTDGPGGFNFPRGSRKDVRDAVAAARKAAGPWAARTAYNRGQILYRAAEALESERRARSAVPSREECAAAVDVLAPLRRLDRQARAGARRRQPGRGAVPVVLAARADRASSGSSRLTRPPLLGLVAELAPALGGRQRGGGDPLGGAAAPRPRPRRGARRLRRPGRASSTCSPGGASELAQALGAHRDLNAIVDAAGDAELSAELDRLAAETIKRVRHGSAAATYAEAVDDALERIEAVIELKTAWHPVGA